MVSSCSRLHTEVSESNQITFDESRVTVTVRILSGESWNCVVGKNFGSHVIHQTEGYLFCSYRDEISILLWKSGWMPKHTRRLCRRAMRAFPKATQQAWIAFKVSQNHRTAWACNGSSTYLESMHWKLLLQAHLTVKRILCHYNKLLVKRVTETYSRFLI